MVENNCFYNLQKQLLTKTNVVTYSGVFVYEPISTNDVHSKELRKLSRARYVGNRSI